MRVPIAAVAGAAVALVAAASVLGVAAAEGPTAAAPRTVSVEGVAIEPLAQGASGTAATAVYRQAMAAAIGDGQAKAAFLAERAGATLGTVQDVAEGGGGISCTGGAEAEEDEYEGEQPDFGYASVPTEVPAVASAPATTSAPAITPKHRKRHKSTAKAKAAAVSCRLATQVALVYALD